MRGRRSKPFVCNDGDENMRPSFLTAKLSPGPFSTEGLTELACKCLLQHHRKTNTCTWPLHLISSPYSVIRNILAKTEPGYTMGLVLLSQCCLMGGRLWHGDSRGCLQGSQGPTLAQADGSELSLAMGAAAGVGHHLSGHGSLPGLAVWTLIVSRVSCQHEPLSHSPCWSPGTHFCLPMQDLPLLPPCSSWLPPMPFLTPLDLCWPSWGAASPGTSVPSPLWGLAFLTSLPATTDTPLAVPQHLLGQQHFQPGHCLLP